MKCISFIDNRIRELFDRIIQKDFDIETELMQEAGYREEEVQKTGLSKSFSFSFFSFLIEKLYKLCLKEGKIINAPYLIKNLPRDAGLSQGKIANGKLNGEMQEYYPGIILHKDIFIKILEKLNLEKTKQIYINWLIINDKEINSQDYLSDKQIAACEYEYKVNEVFSEEYEKKLKNKPRIIIVEGVINKQDVSS